MTRRIKTLLVAGILSLSLITAPRPTLAASVVTDYAEMLALTQVVVILALTLLGPEYESLFESIAASVTETPVSGGNTAVGIEVDDTFLGQGVHFSGSGVFSDTAGSFSGIASVGTQTSPLDIINATTDDPDNPTTFSWDSISTSTFSVGATQLLIDGPGFYQMQVTSGDMIFVQTVVTGTSQSTSFDFNPHIDITTTFGPAAGQLTSDIQVTPAVIPIPGAVWLFASAMVLLGWMRRRLRLPVLS